MGVRTQEAFTLSIIENLARRLPHNVLIQFGIYSLLGLPHLAMAGIHLAKARRDSRYYLSWMTAMGRDAEPDFGSGSGSGTPFHPGTDPSLLAQDDNVDRSSPLVVALAPAGRRRGRDLSGESQDGFPITNVGNDGDGEGFKTRARKRIRMTSWIGHHYLFVQWLNGEIYIFTA